MTFQPASVNAATEIAMPQDVQHALRAFAASARKAREANSYYPRRNEMLAMLSEAAASIERINAGEG